jgi:hypothetical protein
MGIIFMDESLEERLADVTRDVLTDLVVTLRHRSTSQKRDASYRSPYHKHDLIHRIVHYFEEKKIPFGDSYNSAKKYLAGINKEPLKPVEKGMRRKGISDKGIPADFIKRLDDFEKIYFFAGINAFDPNTRDTKENLANHPDLATMDIYELASTYIRAGINHMAYFHNSIRAGNRRKRRVTRGPRQETYQNQWGPPHAKGIKKKLLKPEEIKDKVKQRYGALTSQFGPLFKEEDQYRTASPDVLTNSEKESPLAIIGERISTMLDSLKPFELAILTREYGADRLGQYAIR